LEHNDSIGVLRRIWIENKIPEEWYKEILIPTYKRQTENNIEIIRGIMLLWQIFKIYDRILANILITEIKGKLTEELHAFRAGRATTYLIFGIRQLIEKKQVYGTEFLMVFVHCNKAFDNVKREEICNNLKKIGIATGLFRKVKRTYKRTINRVKTNKKQSAWSETRSEVRQGSIL
jgi:hypothetical protein